MSLVRGGGGYLGRSEGSRERRGRKSSPYMTRRELCSQERSMTLKMEKRRPEGKPKEEGQA